MAVVPGRSGEGRPLPLTAPEVLNREFLEIRCKILELAAQEFPQSRAGQILPSTPLLRE